MSDDEFEDEYSFDIELNEDYGKEKDEDYGYEEDEDKEEDHLFVQGVKQYEQMGVYDPLYEDDLGGKMDFRQRLKLFGAMSGEERFRKMIKQYIMEEKEFKLLDKNDIIYYIEKLKKIEYKNPRAFLIAYYFIKSLKKDGQIKEIVGHFCTEENGVTLEDIVRYIRMIKSLI